jgi:hypothetical protein
MLIPKFEDVQTLLETYMGKRPRRGPFPLESAFTWSVLLSAQACSDIRGGMLEIGVEYGTSAFLMLDALRAGEHATFIDLAETREWLEGINGPYKNQVAYTYIVGNTLKIDPSEIPPSCRWIHIDGGHLYKHVSNDLALAVDSLSDNGVMVLDDFFEIRWPDVTIAVMDFLKTNKKITPFLLVNRKLYCARSKASANSYKNMFSSFISRNGNEVGQVRCWDDVAMMGEQIVVAKMEMSEQLRNLEQ